MGPFELPHFLPKLLYDSLLIFIPDVLLNLKGKATSTSLNESILFLAIFHQLSHNRGHILHISQMSLVSAIKDVLSFQTQSGWAK